MQNCTGPETRTSRALGGPSGPPCCLRFSAPEPAGAQAAPESAPSLGRRSCERARGSAGAQGRSASGRPGQVGGLCAAKLALPLRGQLRTHSLSGWLPWLHPAFRPRFFIQVQSEIAAEFPECSMSLEPSRSVSRPRSPGDNPTLGNRAPCGRIPGLCSADFPEESAERRGSCPWPCRRLGWQGGRAGGPPSTIPESR